MEKKTIALLGSTGSIGTQALEVADECGFEVSAVCANSNIKMLEEQIRKYSPAYCAVGDEKSAADLKVRVSDTNVRVLSGFDGICETAYESKADILLNSLMGKCGIRPTLHAIDSGKNIAMANKEPLVCAGEIILSRAKEKGVEFLPVDSEHSAIFQCLSGGFNRYESIKRLIITASGGPFYGRTRKELEKVTLEQALNHPTWSMGQKITIDSATLMNKGLELIEAVRLFGVPQEKIEITVHRQSIVHSMVEFCDGSVLGQMGNPNMKHCIQFALTYPYRTESLCRPLDFKSGLTLTFSPPDEDTFSLIKTARNAISVGGTAPCILNGANECAVGEFLSRKISFTDIFDLVISAYNSIKPIINPTLEDIEAADIAAREKVLELCS
ncbi:MAG: 1-deoxy-D-xylulose-5-phosphate reductoisomerase [Ruminococcaceae bacterium]|nr:1-deoxy-D-xylulose-5-phosphate reductoisomerase [Oscillospiraceae bacterium]